MYFGQQHALSEWITCFYLLVEPIEQVTKNLSPFSLDRIDQVCEELITRLFVNVQRCEMISLFCMWLKILGGCVLSKQQIRE